MAGARRALPVWTTSWPHRHSAQPRSGVWPRDGSKPVARRLSARQLAGRGHQASVRGGGLGVQSLPGLHCVPRDAEGKVCWDLRTPGRAGNRLPQARLGRSVLGPQLCGQCSARDRNQEGNVTGVGWSGPGAQDRTGGEPGSSFEHSRVVHKLPRSPQQMQGRRGPVGGP